MAIRTYVSTPTLNVNGLNVLTKRLRLAEWIQKQDPKICCLQETYFRPQDTYRPKVRGWKNIFHANRKHKKAGVVILISEKIDLKIKNITRDKEGHYVMIKGSIQEEDITIINIYATSLSLFTFMHWRRKWQPTPMFLPGESQGQGSLVGCHLLGHTKSNTTEVT